MTSRACRQLRTIFSMSSTACRGSPGAFTASCANPRMLPSGSFSSCATPAASCPMVARRSAWRSCSCNLALFSSASQRSTWMATSRATMAMRLASSSRKGDAPAWKGSSRYPTSTLPRVSPWMTSAAVWRWRGAAKLAVATSRPSSTMRAQAMSENCQAAGSSSACAQRLRQGEARLLRDARDAVQAGEFFDPLAQGPFHPAGIANHHAATILASGLPGSDRGHRPAASASAAPLVADGSVAAATGLRGEGAAASSMGMRVTISLKGSKRTCFKLAEAVWRP